MVHTFALIGVKPNYKEALKNRRIMH